MLRFFVATHENLAPRTSRFRQWREKLRQRRSCEKPGERRWLIVRADRVIGSRSTAVFILRRLRQAESGKRTRFLRKNIRVTSLFYLTL